LEKAEENQRKRKEKGRVKDCEDIVMKDGSDNSDGYREIYEDLSGYENEDEGLVGHLRLQKNGLLHVRKQYRLGSDPDQPKHHILTTMHR